MRNLILTIAVPNYNGGENIVRAIASCKYIGLKTDEFEILVVDNASEDESVNIVKSLENKFSNIRLVINKTNVGRIGNWNRCLELAEGKFLMFLFPTEEICMINNIDFIIKKMEGMGIFFAKSNIINRSNFNQLIIKAKNKTKESFEIKDVRRTFQKAVILSGSLPFGPLQSFIFSLNFIKKNNIKFDEKYNIVGDQDFVISIGTKLIEKKVKAAYLFTKSINIIFDDTDKNRTHGQLSQYSRLCESLDLIERRGYYRFIGLKFNDVLYFVLAHLYLLDKIYGYKKDYCGKKIYENDKKKFYGRFHYSKGRMILFFLLTTWAKVIIKIIKIMKNFIDINIARIIVVDANCLNEAKKNK